MKVEPHYGHVPVMLEEVMGFLRPEEGHVYWDLTLGVGGHLQAYLDRAPEQTGCFGLDGDPQALERAGHLNAALIHGDLGDLADVSEAAEWPVPSAILMDLGLSSPQVDDPDRGFSYRNDGPLDMRMNPTVGPTAAEWLNRITQDELATTLRELGGERFAGRIARVIKESLPINTTEQLTRAILRALGGKKSKKQHPARRSFQAIRMGVNRELEKLQSGLEDVISLLAPGGRVVVLSFHSGEDRVVKNLFRENARNGIVKLLTKKPLVCTDAEADINPRARSTKLRAAEKI